jgi:hypothetical protein
MARRLGARHEVVVHAVHSPAIENPARTLEVLLSFWGDPRATVRADDDQAEAVR